MRTIGIIGTGSLGTHLTKLLYKNELQYFVTVSDSDYDKAYKLSDMYGTASTNSNVHMTGISDIIFLTVKPDQIKSVCKDINTSTDKYNDTKTIITAAAGVSVSKVSEWTNYRHRIFRCMPNIPISIGKGSIVWYGPSNNREYQSDQNILNEITTGPKSVWVDKEELLDPATVISGCSPAYIAKMYQIYYQIGQDMGFSPDQTKNLLIESFTGALDLLRTIDEQELMSQVASKGGATEKGLEQMDKSGFTRIIKDSAFSSLDQIGKITKSLN
jgi:pyrroline-5-carboxylate reductase